MANIKSKIKSISKMEAARVKNAAMKSRVRKAIRAAREAVLAKDEKVAEKVALAHSLIGKAVKKGVFHANKGARKHSRLDDFVNKNK
ncbi:30S ribosomal protein S20 [Mycoplasmopsis pullorum]|uniref:Small ribosomal subunit protein bS20 n=1 Tax=Mycoplasmopsis pullorum TaxID=48003 RepID=A0A1L4FR68_9BACT|nr:30S ribosomal protein S20 [Mycoplasmopsis pullorum]APJ38103.1 30S ribosomal protein S20 [Mycoplasmopsis pullorum]APJ38763.1 30S ribosomal protein S20 [Mycoplasmopsis pullorum]APJ38784.1 30S ribosomal protein S20 [Mycoplasmopsis pullorum]TNK82913.1 30S ribosomal protein S20 [Mycoplasmopsis pullorum]TNK91851.1 30S ribosomal protein S20 [Mycoplasmopsis pullorum]